MSEQKSRIVPAEFVPLVWNAAWIQMAAQPGLSLAAAFGHAAAELGDALHNVALKQGAAIRGPGDGGIWTVEIGHDAWRVFLTDTPPG